MIIWNDKKTQLWANKRSYPLGTEVPEGILSKERLESFVADGLVKIVVDAPAPEKKPKEKKEKSYETEDNTEQ